MKVLNTLINKRTFYSIFIGLLILSCSQNTAYNDPIPKHDNFTIDSKILGETRVVNVWTPPNYSTKNDTLPVLYMPDGGIKEDFPHIANTLAKLLESKSIPPFILVGIENTERGRDLTGASQTEADAEYCPLTDGAKNFRAFISDELMTEIDAKYSVSNYKGIIGESLAGLFVMETFFVAPETFNFYIAMDPSLWWNNHYLERHAEKYLDRFTAPKTKLWFAGSDAADISIHTKNLAKSFKKLDSENLTWTYSNEPNEKHNTIFRATKEKAFIWTLNSNEVK